MKRRRLSPIRGVHVGDLPLPIPSPKKPKEPKVGATLRMRLRLKEDLSEIAEMLEVPLGQLVEEWLEWCLALYRKQHPKLPK